METVADQLARVRAVAPALRTHLVQAGVDLDEPDQVLHALVVLCAHELLCITGRQNLDFDDALQAATFAGWQLPRMVRQLFALNAAAQRPRSAAPIGESWPCRPKAWYRGADE